MVASSAIQTSAASTHKLEWIKAAACSGTVTKSATARYGG
jgi:hypothetical protein